MDEKERMERERQLVADKLGLPVTDVHLPEEVDPEVPDSGDEA